MPETSIIILGPPSTNRNSYELLARRHASNVLVCEECLTAKEWLRNDHVRQVFVLAKSSDEYVNGFLSQVRNEYPHVPVLFVNIGEGETLTGNISRQGIAVLPSNLPKTHLEQIFFPALPEASSHGGDKTRTIRIKRVEYPIHLTCAKALFESEFITAALRRERGNVSKTARTLSIGRRNLQLKVHHYQIDIARIRREP